LRSGCCPRAARSDLARRSSRWCTNRLLWNPVSRPRKGDVFRESERAALAAAARVVVTSEATGRILIADYSIQSRRIALCDRFLAEPTGVITISQIHGSGTDS
jgi:hypothetical protein